MTKLDPHILFNTCWCICGLAYFFACTTIIHFCFTSWIDERVPMNKGSKKWLYFISAHLLRVMNLTIAIADMTFEQLADTITPAHTRVLTNYIPCDVSSRVRMSLFLSSFYTYALFCWYKVAIVTTQEPERHSPHIPKTRKKKKSKLKHLMIRQEHPFLDLLWFYIHLIYIVSIICGNIMISPQNRADNSCEHKDNTRLLVAYIVAVLIEFIALIIIFVSPLYQLMKTKKRLFRNVFSNIKVRRHKKKSHENTKTMPFIHDDMLLGNNMMRVSSNDSSQSPAQQEFISRIKGTICRNCISGSISIVLFSGFMFLYTFGRTSGYKQFFTSGIGYVVVFACYLLNYLCLTFSYQNHWPMLLPMVCTPPWSGFRIYQESKISLQQQQQEENEAHVIQSITPLILNDDNGPNVKMKLTQPKSASIPIIPGAHHQLRRGDASFESLLASSHLSATPKYHTLNLTDSMRIQKQYDEYLLRKKHKIMTDIQQKEDHMEDTDSNSTCNSNHHSKSEKKLAPSVTQKSMNKQQYVETLPAPKLSDKHQIKTNIEEEEDTEESSDEYDSEGIDSIQLRTATYDTVTITHHDNHA
eukprot:668011_1